MDGGATLLLVDDHPVFRTGLAAMLASLRPGWRLCGAADAATGLALALETPEVDAVLIDLTLQMGDGFDALAAFGAALPAVPRMVISGRDDAAARVRARAAGASGFINKAWTSERVVAAIARVLDGGEAFEPADAASAPELTGRQAEVLSLLAEGLPNKLIEDRLGIAERTVRAHMTELFQTLGAHNRTQALLRAQKLGLIP